MPVDTAVRQLKRRRTKIVATLGPASRSAERIAELIRSGADVFRLNLSHGTHDDHREACRLVREEAARAGRHVAVLADLSGPKIRAGTFPGGRIVLERGAAVTVTVREVEGGPDLIPSQYDALAGDVTPGSRILLDDGNLELRVERIAETEIACTVVEGGVLKDKKGMNLPGVRVSAPSLTDKDRLDARFALSLGVEFLALSFVRRAADVLELRSLIEDVEGTAAIVAKIEKPEALEDIDAILEVADAIMVARGDLGVELPPEVVPIAQTQLVDAARARGRPVIVATQMLESMVENARPTRAEVSDVSTAVLSGADAVMLSAETASGQHPVRAVEMMDRVARQSEAYLWGRSHFGTLVPPPAGDRSGPLGLESSVARATAQLSRDLLVRAIVVFTRSGWSAGMMAAVRPQAPVIAVSPEPATCRRANLLWGVVPVLGEYAENDELHGLARRVAREEGLAGDGDPILRVWGFHHDPVRNVPTLSVLHV